MFTAQLNCGYTKCLIRYILNMFCYLNSINLFNFVVHTYFKISSNLTFYRTAIVGALFAQLLCFIAFHICMFL